MAGERKPRLRVVKPEEPDGRPILNEAEAKKRFLIYFAVKMAGLAALFGGVFLGQSGINLPSGLLLLAGVVSLFVRPKMLGLTTSPRTRK
ncbi:MAG: hypothetical protein ACMVO5_01185 [Polymorphobacter sp.]|uniref:hypothetical protein n=1 Tax=Polymorphobacter sp. TaxID=1909290 RepID=UPI003A851DE7